MYVCICKGITDKQVAQHVLNDGAGSIRELKQHLDISSQCGTCTKVIQKVINDTIIDEGLFKEVC
ncbi:(2Fe-2S)-binding protein [Thalassotalea sp. G2M2-11]|uniref:(2Fe-2S)-binding protein n=1 Tax=Thalassotalea sp. G2M2-11 TaxID=2787627 RepID=UPI0019D06EBD|nr:(2Fe-2S)-binding protein [Thalassotalea sp. G2M2-11]